MKISVVIPTHNRHQKLQETISRLRRQNFPTTEYEIIVVDDGSSPPVLLSEDFTVLPKVSIVRLEGVERSIARNTGAKYASGELLVFIDDDIAVDESFLAAYWQASRDYQEALFVGMIVLPEESQTNPFGRFRQELEMNGIQTKRGEISEKNFCAAGNMAINSDVFQEISGFDAELTSSEDQDFALRHTSLGRKIVFVPEACGIHNDNALDIRSYCRRTEWGSRLMLAFYERYPNLPANVERKQVNGAILWGREPLTQVWRKILKAFIALPITVKFLFFVTDALERFSPGSKLLDRTYRLLLGAHIFRGYRAAMQQAKTQGKSV